MYRFGLPGRPLSAAIFICSQRLPQAEESLSVSQLVDTVVHELLHGMFFDQSHLQRVPGLLTRNRRAVQSLQVRLAASTLFNCPFENVASVPLDYAGPMGTQGQHWSALILTGDIMSDHFPGVGHRQRSISSVTLALAEDTTWYRRRNPDHKAFLRRGFKSGCDLLQLVCISAAIMTPHLVLGVGLVHGGPPRLLQESECQTGFSPQLLPDASDPYVCDPEQLGPACVSAEFGAKCVADDLFYQCGKVGYRFYLLP